MSSILLRSGALVLLFWSLQWSYGESPEGYKCLSGTPSDGRACPWCLAVGAVPHPLHLCVGLENWNSGQGHLLACLVSALFDVSSIPCQVAWSSALATSSLSLPGLLQLETQPRAGSFLDFKHGVFSKIVQLWCLLLTQNLGCCFVSPWAAATWFFFLITSISICVLYETQLVTACCFCEEGQKDV